jgi:ATP-dependent helicase IRC3
MTAALKMRDYQRSAIDAVFKAWAEGMRRPAIVLPTGAGKTVVFSQLIKEFCNIHDTERGTRVMVLVHRDELADQAIAKIRAVAPDLSVGKVKAGDNDLDADVMVCSVQTLGGRGPRLRELTDWSQHNYGKVGLIITDECHHAAAATYQQIYQAFPDALQLGVTATMARGDGVGLGSVWEEVVYSRSILNLIGNGHLVDVKARNITVDGLDLSDVKTSRGDYQTADLGAAMEESGAQHVISRAYREHASDRQGIVFTPTVATADLTAESLMSTGITAASISGATPREDRLSIFDDFRSGRTQVLVNCMVLTEGFDAPWASCAVIARPTQSQPLYVQMVGRVLRPWAQGGKRDALVLNLNGAGGKLSTLVDLEPGVVEAVRDGETLAEAVEREEKEGRSLVPAGHPAFGLKIREVNLFEASETAWLRTSGGVMFISAGDWCYFLWPSSAGDPGTWDVCRKQKLGRWQRTQHTGLPIELAMSWAEAEAENEGSFSVARSARWRKGTPSSQQEAYARSLGVWRDGMGKDECSDALSVAIESSRLDPFLGQA